MSNSTEPMSKQKQLPFLVVSSSPYMRGILKFVLESLLITEVTELESEEKALLFLKNLTHAPSMIVYDYTPNSFLVEDFIGYLKENSKFVRIVILMDEVRDEGRDLLKEVTQLTLISESSLPQSLVDEAKKTFVDTPYMNESDYCRIDIDFLSILDGINKNLFIKIGEDKFVKVFNENEVTSLVEIQKYKEKGIKYLFVSRSTSLWVIDQIQRQINIFLKANNFRFILRGASDTPQKRFEQKILRIDDEVHVDKDFKLVIEKTIENVRSIVEKEKKVDQMLSMLKENKKDFAFFTQKMNLTCFISCLLARQLEWSSKTTFDKLIYAAVLGDITLAVKPDLLKIKNLSAFDKVKQDISEDDQKIFLGHPKDAANLIQRYFNTAPPDTDVLALQHHEMPDGSGFPMGLKADKISPLAALFIVANEFSYYYLTDDEPSVDDFLLKNQGRYDYVNFRKVVKALEKIKRS